MKKPIDVINETVEEFESLFIDMLSEKAFNEVKNSNKFTNKETLKTIEESIQAIIKECIKEETAINKLILQRLRVNYSLHRKKLIESLRKVD